MKFASRVLAIAALACAVAAPAGADSWARPVVREVFSDWATERPGVLRIQRADRIGARRDTTGGMELRFQGAGGFLQVAQNVVTVELSEHHFTPEEIRFKAGQAVSVSLWADPSSAFPGRVREIASWELRQKYFLDEDFGGAVVPGKRNVLTTTAMFSGIAFLTEARRWSPLVSELRIRAGENTDGEWQLDIDHVHGRINSSTTLRLLDPEEVGTPQRLTETNGDREGGGVAAVPLDHSEDEWRDSKQSG